MTPSPKPLLEKNFPATYDPAQVDALFRLRRNPKAWRRVCARFFTVLGMLLKVIFYHWYDNQIWSYLGADDIERAQSLRRQRHARWLVDTLLLLGPTFIKIGQSLSTRVDLVRREYIDALAKLQDRVPPFPFPEAHRILTQELGKDPSAVFAWLDPVPLAAASLGQVHRARLRDDAPSEPGAEIILKIQRPHLLETIYLDLAVLRKIACFLQKHTELGRERQWVGIVDEFGRTLLEEVDYIQEGRNADTFRKNFRENPRVRIPAIHWRYTSRRVIAMEYLPGAKINDLRAIDDLNLSREALATLCVKAYFQQILVNGFFHADPHPGNIAVGEDGTLIFYDFGMVGRMEDKMRLSIVEAFLNVVNKKPDHILENLLTLGMIAPNADLEVIRQVIVWALDHYYDVPHDALNLEDLADELGELMYAHPFQLPANFTFMIRALITLEGVATTLYPSIQFMGIAVDYARQFLGQTLRFDALVQKGMDLLGLGGENAPQRRVPQRVRLQHDEWTPLARYVKLGFGLLAIGQLGISGLLLWLVAAQGGLSTGVLLILSFVVGFYHLLWILIALLMPARRKPYRFDPMLPTANPRGGHSR